MNKATKQFTESYGKNMALYFQEFMRSTATRRMIEVRRDKSEITFCFKYQGYDPRNHHGRFMHNQFLAFDCVKHELIIIDDFGEPIGCDPYNHRGTKL